MITSYTSVCYYVAVLKAFVFTSLILLLTACSPTPNSDLLEQASNLHEGYPCFDYCEDFAFGYDRAKNRDLKNPDDCLGENDHELLGCQAYVHEYKAEHELDFIFNSPENERTVDEF